MYAVSVYGDSDRKESYFMENERRTVSKEGGSKERKCVAVYLTSKYVLTYTSLTMILHD